jgi:hypothetical protein
LFVIFKKNSKIRSKNKWLAWWLVSVWMHPETRSSKIVAEDNSLLLHLYLMISSGIALGGHHFP